MNKKFITYIKLPSLIILLFLVVNLLIAQSPQGEEPGVINLESRVELFVDYFLIDHLENARLVLHEPIDEGPVLHFDNPWEGPF